MLTSELTLNPTTTKPLYYAEFRPRGFANEYEIMAFSTKALRNQFVSAVPRSTYSEYYRAWVQNEQNARAYAISAKDAAAKTLNDRKGSDYCTTVYLTLRQLFGIDARPKGNFYNAEGYGCEFHVVDKLDSDGYEPKGTLDLDEQGDPSFDEAA